MININIEVARAVPQLNDAALTLAIFKYARAKTGVTVPIRINSLADLYANFDAPDPLGSYEVQEFRELYSAEYLLRAGVNLLIYTTDAPNVLDDGDIDNISDIEVLDYKFIVAPYVFLGKADYATLGIDKLLELVDDTAVPVELYVDASPLLDTADLATLKAQFTAHANAKFEIFINAGFTSFQTNYDLPDDIVLSEAYQSVDGVYTAATDFIGIPASLAAIARKAKLILADQPWLPVAGETYGIVEEFTSLFRALSTVEKEAFQAANINVLVTRIGVGNLFVSQNTMFPADIADTINPLLRSHVVTEALWIKRQLNRIAQATMSSPNIQKTWDLVALKLNAIFKELLDKDGIESYKVYIGRNVTMTAADITAGILKVAVNYVPVRVIEDITFNVTVNETESLYDVVLSGGEL